MNLTTALRIVALEANRRANDALKPTGLTFCQYTLLEAVATHPGINGGKAARVCSVTPQNAWTAVGNLIGNGFVEQRPIPGIGRAIPLYATRTGKNRLRRARLLLAAVDVHYNTELGQGLADALDVLADTIINPAKD